MEIVYLLAGSAIILTCFYFIISPFFLSAPAVTEGLEEQGEKVTLETVYEAVNELEMDYLMKKVNEKDFLLLKDQYQLVAAELLKKDGSKQRNMNVSRQTEEAELELLRELQRLRKQKGRSS